MKRSAQDAGLLTRGSDDDDDDRGNDDDITVTCSLCTVDVPYIKTVSTQCTADINCCLCYECADHTFNQYIKNVRSGVSTQGTQGRTERSIDGKLRGPIRMWGHCCKHRNGVVVICYSRASSGLTARMMHAEALVESRRKHLPHKRYAEACVTCYHTWVHPRDNPVPLRVKCPKCNFEMCTGCYHSECASLDDDCRGIKHMEFVNSLPVVTDMETSQPPTTKCIMDFVQHVRNRGLCTSRCPTCGLAATKTQCTHLRCNIPRVGCDTEYCYVCSGVLTHRADEYKAALEEKIEATYFLHGEIEGAPYERIDDPGDRGLVHFPSSMHNNGRREDILNIRDVTEHSLYRGLTGQMDTIAQCFKKACPMYIQSILDRSCGFGFGNSVDLQRAAAGQAFAVARLISDTEEAYTVMLNQFNLCCMLWGYLLRWDVSSVEMGNIKPTEGGMALLDTHKNFLLKVMPVVLEALDQPMQEEERTELTADDWTVEGVLERTQVALLRHMLG